MRPVDMHMRDETPPSGSAENPALFYSFRAAVRLPASKPYATKRLPYWRVSSR